MMYHGNFEKSEINGMKVISEKMADTCPCRGCGGWVTRTHGEDGGSKDNCGACGFEGIRLHVSDYEELLFLLGDDVK